MLYEANRVENEGVDMKKMISNEETRQRTQENVETYSFWICAFGVCGVQADTSGKPRAPHLMSPSGI